MQDARAQLLACIPRLRRYARALVGGMGADDLVQDTIERGLVKLPLRPFSGNMRAWLFSIMHNLHIDQIRKARLPTEVFDDDAPALSVAAAQTDGLEIRDLESSLRLLPTEQREVLLLVALEEMTYDEVAATLQIPLGTVMSRLSRAREKMRALMDGRTVVSPLKVVK
ncbi:RNA polymerase sigma factor [Collimonas antrihumi]|uniref:RNA polymerase sigma factor n=1 Tax=Collimonas antrihumi TaxID=1940615 RepID=UPI001B8B839E|nr:RNA polymerase sigma factor [Collimonas antrihumi]